MTKNEIPKYAIKILEHDTMDQKALKKYLSIIQRAKKQDRKKLKKDNPFYIYYERHHILPKSLYPKYKNNKNLTVLLTAEEHFIVHLLLTTILPSKQMATCAILMTKGQNKQKYIVTPKQYKIAREAIAKNPPGKGHIWSKESRDKLSKARAGIKVSKRTRKKLSASHKGIKQSPETIEKRMKKIRGCTRDNKLKKQISETLKGHKVTKRTRAKLSKANKNKKYNECLLNLNKIFKNRNGTKYKIVEIISYRTVKIMFLDQYKYTTTVDINIALRKGKCKEGPVK